MRSPVVHAWFRFYAELNDFLPEHRRGLAFLQPVAMSDTVKHVVESFGVPHTEVELILVNGRPADWSIHLQEHDRVSVYPSFTRIDVSDVNPLAAERIGDPRFLLDGHLGRLAAYLRMLGFDTSYDKLADDELLAERAAAEDRILLTRDLGLLKRKNVRRGHFVRSDDGREQLRGVVLRFDLLGRIAPFTRCMDCNGVLHRVAKDLIEDQLPPHTRLTKNEFSRCQACGKIYWKGSHHSEMTGWIQELHQCAPASR